MNGNTKLNVDAPQDMYTMPDARISHFISDDQLAVIETGGRDRFFDYHLAAAGASLGFLQNIVSLTIALWTKKPPSGWDIIFSLFFVALLAATICFKMATSTTDDPVKKVVSAIRKRPAKPFHSEGGHEGGNDDLRSATLSGPTVRGRDIGSILQDALRNNPPPEGTGRKTRP